MKVKKSATDTISEFAFISDEKINYNVHVQNDGWQNVRTDGEIAGTEGRSLRLEAIKIRLTGEMSKKYDIYYKVHAQGFGWIGQKMVNLLEQLDIVID